MVESGLFAHVDYVRAGKFRRYHDESLLRRIFDVKTNALNVRDAFYVLIGCFQAFVSLRRRAPDAIFAKGGFVVVPVGVAARLRRIPFMTHDSDAVPGLANRIIGRWAAHHATGLPVSFYDYPEEKTSFVGVPGAADFKKATPAMVKRARKAMGIPENAEVVLVTGGSQGSQRINSAVKAIARQLLGERENVWVVHHLGSRNHALYGDFTHERLITATFFDNFAEVAAAADVIITRAGANSMTEFGLLEKATVVIPSPFLANGHQLKNARQLAETDAIVELDEPEITRSPEVLLKVTRRLLDDKNERRRLASNLRKATKADAAAAIARLVYQLGKKSHEA